MKIVTVFIFWLVLIFNATNAYPQTKTPATPEQIADKFTQWMKVNLELTSAQVNHVQSINLKYANKLQELKQSPNTKQQKMRALKADGDAKDQELKRVLTSEQFQTWIDKKEDVKKEMKETVKADKHGG
jgi:hypothetical protein